MSNDMHDDMHDDAVLATLATARPDPDPSDHASTADAQALLAQIVDPTTTSIGRSPRKTRSRRVRVGAGALSAAAAILVAVVAVNTVGVDGGKVVVQQQPASADVAAIATASTRAVSSGRAEMTFASRTGETLEQRGTAQVAFSGPDRDVTMHFAGDSRSPGFDAHNMTVDGQFYLFDQHWIHDTAVSTTGSDSFDLDPRGLLDVLRPAAGFVVVDAASTPSGEVRHLRATHLGASPTLHLALGPVGGRDITSLELWVGADDTVQRLEVEALHTEDATSCFVQDGFKQCLKPGEQLAKVNGEVKIVPGPANAPAKPTVTTARFTVRFTDIGQPISITAPVGAVEVQGKG
jgi:hypothetical protein